MDEYKVSVIIPIYNAEKFLNNCINSLKQQSIGFNNIEVILVNDASTDNTNKVLKKYEKYDNFKIFNLKENSGTPSKPVNIGIKHASTDYIMFLDSDDEYTENMCEVLYNTIKETNSNIVMCNYDILNNGVSIKEKKIENLEKTIYNTQKDLEIFEDILRWNKIFNRNFVKENVNVPYGILGEDTVFCVSAYLNTDKVIYLKNFYGYNYNLNNLSITKRNNTNLLKKCFNGYYYSAKIIKNKKRSEVIPFVYEKSLRATLISFIMLNDTNKNKIEILKEIYNLEKYLKTPIPLQEKWAQILNNLILKRKFKIAMIFSKIISILYNSNTIKKIHQRKIQQKGV